MDDSLPRIRIPGPSRGEMIEYSAEYWEEYKNCFTSKFKTALYTNFLTSTAITVSVPFKEKSLYKKGVLWGALFLVGQFMSQLYCKNGCIEEEKKLMQSSVHYSSDHVKVASETPSQSDEPQSFEYQPPALSDADMSPPSSFSLDPGFKIYGTEEEKSVPKVVETKPVTYEELRARSRDQLRQRPYNNTSNFQANLPERKHGDDSSSSTWPRKTNIYGDSLE